MIMTESFVVVSDRDGFVAAYDTLADAQEALRPYVGFPFVFTRWPRGTAPMSGNSVVANEAVVNEAVANEAVANDKTGVATLVDDASGETADKTATDDSVVVDDASDDEATVDGDKSDNATDDEIADGKQKAPDVEMVWVLPYTANNVVAFASTDIEAVKKAQSTLLRLELVPPDDVKFWECEMGTIAPAAKRRFDEVLAVRDTVNTDKETIERFLDFASRGETPAEELRVNNILESVVPYTLEE